MTVHYKKTHGHVFLSVQQLHVCPLNVTTPTNFKTSQERARLLRNVHKEVGVCRSVSDSCWCQTDFSLCQRSKPYFSLFQFYWMNWWINAGPGKAWKCLKSLGFKETKLKPVSGLDKFDICQRRCQNLIENSEWNRKVNRLSRLMA